MNDKWREFPVEDFEGVWVESVYDGCADVHVVPERFNPDKPIRATEPVWIPRSYIEQHWGRVRKIMYCDKYGIFYMWTDTHVISLEQWEELQYLKACPRSPEYINDMPENQRVIYAHDLLGNEKKNTDLNTDTPK